MLAIYKCVNRFHLLDSVNNPSAYCESLSSLSGYLESSNFTSFFYKIYFGHISQIQTVHVVCFIYGDIIYQLG